MKVLRFLKNHKLNLAIALALLLVLANCELALPATMRNIIDTGISGSGITSTVPDWISEDDYKFLELFLSPSEKAKMDKYYVKTDDVQANNCLTFIGDDVARNEISSFLTGIEVIAFRFNQGIPVDKVARAFSHGEAYVEDMLLRYMTGESDGLMYPYDLMQFIEQKGINPTLLYSDRAYIMSVFGDTGVADISSRAIEYVRQSYIRAGIDLTNFQNAYLMREGLIMLAFAGISVVCAVLATLNASRTAATVARELRHDLFERVLSFSPREMDQFSTASLITRGTNDIQQIQSMLVLFMRTVLLSPCLGFCALYRVFTAGNTTLQWVIGAAVFAIAAVVGILMGLTIPKFRRMQSLVDRNNLIAREILTGIVPVRAFGRSKYEEERYDGANKELTDTYIFTNRAMSFMMPAMLVVMNLSSLAIIWFGGSIVNDGLMKFGDLVAYMNYTTLVIRSCMVLTMVAVTLPRADVAADRVKEVLDTYSTVVDPDDLDLEFNDESDDDTKDMNDNEDDSSWDGVLSFNDVSFTYPGSDIPALEHVSFTAQPGETLGIIGQTGAGKTTLVQLIPRFYDVTEGSVLLDGIDIRTIGLEELRSQIGYAPQKTMLFSGTIESNIKYGNPDMPDDQMLTAAQTAQAMEFVDSKENAFQSAISQGGSNISGGQRQRLSIARALAPRPKVLVFDDSFSALDYKTDAALRQALGEYKKDSTVVVVAQRIASVMHANRILVLENGCVVGDGTHEDLLRSCAAYREIAMSQLSASELGIEADAATPAQDAEGQSC